MIVSKFKAGDRVRITVKNACGATVNIGDLGTVHNPYGHIVMDFPRGLSRRRFGEPFDWHIASDCLELVEPLKLEVGATVVIAGGKDEWEVTDDWPGHVSIRRNQVKATARARDLTVVKAKPEPSFYVNCADKIPRDGDVYLNQHGGLYVWRRGGDVYSHNYRRIGPSNGLAKERTLLVRDGKPYTG